MSIIYQTMGKLLYGVYLVIQNYGLAIILFTIIIKLLYSLNFKTDKLYEEDE